MGPGAVTSDCIAPPVWTVYGLIIDDRFAIQFYRNVSFEQGDIQLAIRPRKFSLTVGVILVKMAPMLPPQLRGRS